MPSLKLNIIFDQFLIASIAFLIFFVLFLFILYTIMFNYIKVLYNIKQYQNLVIFLLHRSKIKSNCMFVFYLIYVVIVLQYSYFYLLLINLFFLLICFFLYYRLDKFYVNVYLYAFHLLLSALYLKTVLKNKIDIILKFKEFYIK